MTNKQLAKEWLSRAQSNIQRAEVGKATEGIYFEDLCFDCQQAVEKSLKALFVFHNIEFPYSHNINRLIDMLVENKISVPNNIFDAAILADYAVETRYPRDCLFRKNSLTGL